MADWWDAQDTWLAWLYECWDTGVVLSWDCVANTDDAWDEWGMGNYDDAFYSLCGAMYALSSSLAQFTYHEDDRTVPHSLLAYIDNYASLSMDTLLNLMLQATYDQLQKFVGISDAYRCAIWDQPFNAEFYAALANGFRP